MKTRREYIGGSMALSLLLVTTAVIADESAPASEFAMVILPWGLLAI